MRICVLVLAIGFSVAAPADPPALQQDPVSARLYDLATREAQYNALRAIPGAQVQYGSFGRLKQLDGLTGIRVPEATKLKRGDSADILFQGVKRMLLATDAESLVVSESGTEPFGTNYFVFTDQVIDGIPVIDARVNFLLDANNEIKLIVSQFVPRWNASSKPQLSEQAAKAKLAQVLRDTQLANAQGVSGGSLAFWTDQGKAEAPRLLWMFATDSTTFGVDAATGDVRYSVRLVSDLQRTVYTHNYRSDSNFPLPSALLWTEGNVPQVPDPQGFGIYQRVVYPVNAWGDHPFTYNAMGLVAHWGRPYNGMYKDNGSRASAHLYFSDERAFDDDAIAHEYGHGLFVDGPLRPSSSFIPKVWDQFFAGSEFWGDLSAVMTDIHRYGMRGNETWAITDLRDWRDPRSKAVYYQDWYPNRSFINPFLGPAYANSTIFGHGVYLMINGGTHRRAGQQQFDGSLDPSTIPTINVPPADHGQVKQVLSYAVWLMRLYSDRFDGPMYKTRTMQAAVQLYGPSQLSTTIENAWTAVGIGSGCSAPPSKPVITEFVNQYCRGKFKVSWQQVLGVKYHAEITPVEQSFDSALTASVLDAASNLCRPTISRDSLWRMQACNGCGCSDWTSPLWMSYFSTCQ
jgi:hypothetical protein